MKYGFIVGDKYTKFEPLVFIFDNGEFEVICRSYKRQQDYYDYLKNNKFEDLDSLLGTFSYQNVETGEVTPEVESMLNKLRSKFMLEQVADEEISRQEEQAQNPNRRVEAALLKISKRMRTGENER